MEENDSAFPHETYKYHDGLTVRDYIAIQAMQGLLAACSEYYCKTTMPNFKIVARHSYEIADAMIKESNRVTKAED